MGYRKLWIALGVVMVASFAVLGGVGFTPLIMHHRSPRKW